LKKNNTGSRRRSLVEEEHSRLKKFTWGWRRRPVQGNKRSWRRVL